MPPDPPRRSSAQCIDAFSWCAPPFQFTFLRLWHCIQVCMTNTSCVLRDNVCASVTHPGWTVLQLLSCYWFYHVMLNINLANTVAISYYIYIYLHRVCLCAWGVSDVWSVEKPSCVLYNDMCPHCQLSSSPPSFLAHSREHAAHSVISTYSCLSSSILLDFSLSALLLRCTWSLVWGMWIVCNVYCVYVLSHIIANAMVYFVFEKVFFIISCFIMFSCSCSNVLCSTLFHCMSLWTLMNVYCNCYYFVALIIIYCYYHIIIIILWVY